MLKLKPSGAFSGFSVDNLAKAKQFYTETLSLKVLDERMGLMLELPGGGRVFIYEKPDHQPATYTMLNLEVDDIDEAVDVLLTDGVAFERYEAMHQDEKGIARGRPANMGPDIAWFKDPAGNILSILH